MADDISAKLASLKDLRGEMKDWKKDDLRKKKGIKDSPKEQKSESKAERDAQGDDKQPGDEDNDVLARLIKKLVK